MQRVKQELKIFTPIGMLGQGFNESIFWETLEKGVDAIILDSGSTDGGPGKLAFGETSVPRSRYERDLGLLVKACQIYRIPVLIGSAGGNGENRHVQTFVDIIQDLISKNDYRPMKIVTIQAEIPKDLVRAKLENGLIEPCGGGVPALQNEDVDAATRVVAQMGHEPFLKAMEDNPDFDIIIGGRAYDPAPYAAYCLYNGFTNMGKLMSPLLDTLPFYQAV